MSIKLIKGIEVFEDQRNDISDVLGFLKSELQEEENKTCDIWSCFNGAYKVSKEHEFIERKINENPDRYDYFKIVWYNSN